MQRSRVQVTMRATATATWTLMALSPVRPRPTRQAVHRNERATTDPTTLRCPATLKAMQETSRVMTSPRWTGTGSRRALRRAWRKVFQRETPTSMMMPRVTASLTVMQTPLVRTKGQPRPPRRDSAGRPQRQARPLPLREARPARGATRSGRWRLPRRSWEERVARPPLPSVTWHSFMTPAPAQSHEMVRQPPRTGQAAHGLLDRARRGTPGEVLRPRHSRRQQPSTRG